jgi:hypothetical protein
MTSEKIIELFGHSIKSANLSEIMEELKMDINPKFSIAWAKSTFESLSGFKREFGEPVIITNSEDDLILSEIDIDSKYEETKELPSIPFPFNLSIKDDQNTVISKLGKKPFDKSKNTYGYSWWFMFDEYRVLIALNFNFELIWVRIMKLSSEEKEKIRLKKHLSSQTKNIIPENSSNVLAFKNSLPTIDWRERKKHGDDIFTESAIENVEELLLNYITKVAEDTRNKKPTNIYNSVKKIVSALNKVNNKNNKFIETTEREELAEFINKVVLTTGLVVDQNTDLTEEWREWQITYV